ncbi:MAG: hypothetical protein FJ216_08585 [Ignavibacteria bacterium]|nr:hypothetical protein [Ignavibacteria bacterium]
MNINHKFEELKYEIHKTLINDEDSLCALELKYFSADELLETGYIEKSVLFMLKECSPDHKEIEEYFEINCSRLTPDDFGDVEVKTSTKEIGEYIFNLKCEVIKQHLKSKLYYYINFCKTNNNSSDNLDDII